MYPAPSYRRIGIVGSGRVAQAMAWALHPRSSDPLLVWGRDPERRDRLVASVDRARAAPDLQSIGSACDCILIAVADDAIPDLVDRLSGYIPHAATPFILHMSGRSGAGILAPLEQQGALTAAVHPAMTFTGAAAQEVARMVGARFVITAATPMATLASERLVGLLGGIPEHVEEAKRALYHAALCHAANHLVTLVAGSCDALRTAGVADPASLLAPLVRAALDNVLDRGMAGLSGPLLRGDEGSIHRHLSAIAVDSPQLLPPYRAMATATLDALEGGGATIPTGLRRILA